MFPPTIPGWFMGIRSWPGRGGTRIRESGLAVLTFPSGSDLALGGSAALGGAGAIGDLIGITATRFTTMAGTSQGAERSITGAVSIEEEHAADFVPAPRTGLSMETAVLLEDMRPPAARVASARELLADTTAADRQGPFRRAADPAWVAVAERAGAAAVAGIGN